MFFVFENHGGRKKMGEKQALPHSKERDFLQLPPITLKQNSSAS